MGRHRKLSAGTLRLALELFKEKIKIAFIYGSAVKGSDTAGSDIDLRLISDQLTYPKQETGGQKEFDGLLHSGRTRLKDSHLLLQPLEWNTMAKGMWGIKRQVWRDDSSKTSEKEERELRERIAQDGEGLENSWDINEIIQ